ncbi:MAG: dTDP-4-dehydrorhamnose 3,5-epimerase [Firmicutes bacterium]|nr:dTDP-4-dehydrorhamnose 3,5-epimerase [Bacillota bacterium]
MIQKFAFEKTEIEDLFLVKPFVAYDERGYFLKDYSQPVFVQNGLPYDLKEVFYTNSNQGVIRAIHFQREKAQAKLVRCVFGKIFDVVVDLCKESNTFGKWQGFYLSEENKDELLIPGHCGHGYLVLRPAIVSYKCAENFYGEYDDGIVWNDADIKIDWPLHLVDNIVLSVKDQNLQTFSEFRQKYTSL